MVEGGRIDHAHHENWANRAMEETVAMDQALRDTLEELERQNILEETLIIVTADHSHVMTMMGYGQRGTDIRGKQLFIFNRKSGNIIADIGLNLTMYKMSFL